MGFYSNVWKKQEKWRWVSELPGPGTMGKQEEAARVHRWQRDTGTTKACQWWGKTGLEDPKPHSTYPHLMLQEKEREMHVYSYTRKRPSFLTES